MKWKILTFTPITVQKTVLYWPIGRTSFHYPIKMNLIFITGYDIKCRHKAIMTMAFVIPQPNIITPKRVKMFEAMQSN